MNITNYIQFDGDNLDTAKGRFPVCLRRTTRTTGADMMQ